jgi:hypothetical protein
MALLLVLATPVAAMGWYCYLEDKLAFPFLAR